MRSRSKLDGPTPCCGGVRFCTLANTCRHIHWTCLFTCIQRQRIILWVQSKRTWGYILSVTFGSAIPCFHKIRTLDMIPFINSKTTNTFYDQHATSRISIAVWTVGIFSTVLCLQTVVTLHVLVNAFRDYTLITFSGLCGDMNGNEEDDLRGMTEEDFGNMWKTSGGKARCSWLARN